MTYANLLWNISQIVIYNVPLILFSIIGLLFAKKHSPIIWFIIGLGLMLLSYYGGFYRLTHTRVDSLNKADLVRHRNR